jgi:hypothetical protein
MNRRHFLSRVGEITAVSGVALAASRTAGEVPAAATTLPTIALGKHQVTRLVVGSNPINGYSYQGPHTDRHMVDYYTTDRAAEMLLACERAGINTHQFSTSGIAKAEAILNKVREQGSKMQFICLGSKLEEVPSIVERTHPFAIVHHGGATDRLFDEGKSQRVHDYVKATHDQGLLAGVSAHNPDNIRTIADGGWEVDFFMTCFYFVSRKPLVKPGEQPPPSETLDISYTFYRNDPVVMTAVVRQVKQPCLGFKILAAGRMCKSQETVRNAFRFAFENIKPTDGVIVGMYPRFFDEITANVEYARQCAGGRSS